MTLEEVADNHGLTPEGVDYALRQYQIVISEITHGLLSKLSYDAHDVLQCAQERWCDTCDLKREVTPWEPINGGWISVKDGLPKRPANWPRCQIKRCYFLVALESGCVESLGFDFDDMRWHITGSPVAYWMPLPEPPKEG